MPRFLSSMEACAFQVHSMRILMATLSMMVIRFHINLGYTQQYLVSKEKSINVQPISQLDVLLGFIIWHTNFTI